MAGEETVSPEVIQREIRFSRGRVLGEAVWRRVCQAAGLDPKDPELEQRRQNLVAAVQGATQVMDEAGFDGLERWLELEEQWADAGAFDPEGDEER